MVTGAPCAGTVLMNRWFCVSVQCVFFGALAITTLRMKYLWTPYMCVLAAVAIADSQVWSGVLSLVKCRTVGLVSYWWCLLSLPFNATPGCRVHVVFENLGKPGCCFPVLESFGESDISGQGLGKLKKFMIFCSKNWEAKQRVVNKNTETKLIFPRRGSDQYVFCYRQQEFAILQIMQALFIFSSNSEKWIASCCVEKQMQSTV